MSLSILFTPATLSSFQDDLVYTVSDSIKVSDPVTYPNFKFLGDVYVNGVFVARLKKTPHPTTGIGVFNVGQVVRNYAAMIFNPAPGVVAQVAGLGLFNLSVQMKFGEEYSFTDYINVTVDSSRTFFNHYNARLKGPTSAIISFADSIASNNSILSGQCLFSNSNFFVSYFPTTTAPVNFIVVPTGGGSGYSTTFTPANAYDLQILNLSPGGLNAVHPGTITANTTSYTVQVGSQIYTIQVVCEAQYTPYMVHFLNQYGGFESKLFTKVSRKSYDLSKSDFGKIPYTVDGSGIVAYKNTNGVYNETRSVYADQFTENLVLNSDWVNDSHAAWLSDLVLSNMIYLEDSGYFYPVILSDSSYEVHKFINDDFTNLTINITFGNTLNTQFR